VNLTTHLHLVPGLRIHDAPRLHLIRLHNMAKGKAKLPLVLN
jgi:hypothetical protein